MRKFLRFLLGIFIALIVLTLSIVGIHKYNAGKYAVPGPDMKDPQTVLDDGNATFIEGNYLRGFHMPPLGEAKPGTVIVFGGSEGSADPRKARELQKEGFNVLALYFWGQPGQKATLNEVPLDFFDEVLTWIDANANPDEPITILGTSKGAELVANLASRYSEVDNFIAYAPSEYTYQGLQYDQYAGSSFTYHGQPVPYLKFVNDPKIMIPMMTRFTLALPVSYLSSYEQAVEKATDTERDAARIDLTGFSGNGILFAGEQDTMWQSATAAKALAAQNPKVEAFVYDNAGHAFAEDITLFGPSWEVMLGGTVEGNRIAYQESQQVLFDKLNTWHGTSQ